MSGNGNGNGNGTGQEYARQAGLTVTAESRLGSSAAGSPAAYEQLTTGRIVSHEVRRRVEMSRERSVTHLDIIGDRQPGALGIGAAPGEDAIEGRRAGGTARAHAAAPRDSRSATPLVTNSHLNPPHDVVRLLMPRPAFPVLPIRATNPVSTVDGPSAHT
ncbi:hypothetical protein [Streptomyces sp. SD31]|uniref:hypothetical protein n=1 Tax=Streptomyces sp. SD31 TaxID=3452208 RepID=UPI003F88D186